MSSTQRITVTLSAEQVGQLRQQTDNVSGYIAAAMARQLRHELLADDLRGYQEKHGAFTDEELTKARDEMFGGDACMSTA